MDTSRKLSRTASLRLPLAASALVGLGLVLSSDLSAMELAACCMGPIGVGDAFLNPPVGGDKDFFSGSSVPSSVVFLLGNNTSMQDYLTPLPESAAGGNAFPTGCTDPGLAAAVKAFYDPAAAGCDLNGSSVYDPDQNFTGDGFFAPAKFFPSYATRLDPSAVSASFTSTTGQATAAAACALYWPPSSADHGSCVSCLGSAGWYRGDVSAGKRRWVLKGSLLNVAPPKFVIARRAIKEVVLGYPYPPAVAPTGVDACHPKRPQVDRVRLGLAVFDQTPAGLYDPANLVAPLRPLCNNTSPNFSLTLADRQALQSAVNSVTFTAGERSLGEAIYSLGGYFSSQKADGKWGSWFSTNTFTAPAGYPGSSTWTDGYPDFLWNPRTNTTTNPAGAPFEAGGQDLSVCLACQSSAIVAIADGAPDSDNSVPVSRMLDLLIAKGEPLTFAPGTANPGGVNFCPAFGAPLTACDVGLAPQGPDSGNKNFADDAAYFLSHMDLRGDYTGDQKVRTYVVGLGDNSPMLQSIAKAGRGRFFRGDTAVDVRGKILSSIQDVRESATSFATASVSNVQAGGLQGGIYVPRFTPHIDVPFEGHLFRFRLFDEFAEGCDAAKAAAAKVSNTSYPLDVDGDGFCKSTFFMDLDGDVVRENTDNAWVKQKTATANPDGTITGGMPAVPYWDAGGKAGVPSADPTVAPTVSADDAIPTGLKDCASGGRCIFTMIDRNHDGRFDATDNPPIEFTKANRDLLMDFLFGAGATHACDPVFSKLGLVWTDTLTNRQKCAETLIDFIRATDVFNYNGNFDPITGLPLTQEDRPCAGNPKLDCKLGDIFHSSPVLVDPPPEPWICDLGLSNQCARTLYADFNFDGNPPISEPVCSPTSAKPCYAATPMSPAANYGSGQYGAYDDWRQNTSVHKAGTAPPWISGNTTVGKRDRILLAGANDGMLHAFHAGNYRGTTGTRKLAEDLYDTGTGRELWAFIPPDLLPKLSLLIDGHQYYVDGTVMVRDIWYDEAMGGIAGTKEAAEMHTVAVLSERGGGNRYLALDVTDPLAMIDAALNGSGAKVFRWMYPQACDVESVVFGQSWMNYAPKPPPIGAVRLKNASNNRGWDERWITFVSGGYSADLLRGRGVYMLDVWTGQKLWSFGADVPGTPAPTAPYDINRNEMMPVAAAPALVDVGDPTSVKPDQDGFFDTAVVSDIGGQVWTLRFKEPGVIGVGGTVTNWYGARTYETARGQTDNMHEPFFNIASNTLQPETGVLRTFLGTGDRQNLRTNEQTACTPTNLLGCIRQGCSFTFQLETKLGSAINMERTVSYNWGNTNNTLTVTPDGTPTLGSFPASCGTVNGNNNQWELEMEGFQAKCPAGNFTNNYSVTGGSAEMNCQNGATGWQCTTQTGSLSTTGGANATPAFLATLPRNRYVGFFSYGGTRVFNTSASAVSYDDQRLTDVPWLRADDCGVPVTVPGTGCTLKDVTLRNGYNNGTFVLPANLLAQGINPLDGKSYTYVDKAVLTTFVTANPTFKPAKTDPGWLTYYTDIDEKTAAGSTILASVVFWPTFLPPPPGATGVDPCASLVRGDSGRSWQADITTGLPDQSPGFKFGSSGFIPYKVRAVSAPPPEPANVITLSKSGKIRMGTLVADPGSNPQSEQLAADKDIATDVYWVDVPRDEHVCRHLDRRACE